MQAVWRFLLDADFVDAYENRIVIKFPDGIFRCVFLRIFTYAADYPEKYSLVFPIFTHAYSPPFGRILLTCMKFLGRCPCPRCFVEKDNIDRLGNKHDRWLRTHKYRVDNHQRRNWIELVCEMIFIQGRSVISQAVEGLIGTTSLVPTRVRTIVFNLSTLTQIFRTPFQRCFPALDLISTLCSCLISCTSSNLVYGKQSLLTCYEFSTHMVMKLFKH